jgi:hypothetical protein
MRTLNEKMFLYVIHHTVIINDNIQKQNNV